jgi:hypothetical protein
MRRRGPLKRSSLKKENEEPGFMKWTFSGPTSKAEDKTSHVKGFSLDSANIGPQVEDELSTDNESNSSRELWRRQSRPTPEVCVNDLLPSSPFRFISPHPLSLTPLQSLFLDHYLNNFSLKYPTYLDPSNPFLSTLVPLALRNKTVLCAVLAIGGIQTGLEGRPDVKAEILSLKGRVLRGCRKLLQRFHPSLYAEYQPANSDEVQHVNAIHGQLGTEHERTEEDDLMLFAGVILLMVHDKLSGEPYSNLRPHLMFAHHFEGRNQRHERCGAQLVEAPPASAHYKFLRNIFLYNDLLASIASGSPTLRDYGQDTDGCATKDSTGPDGSLTRIESSLFKLASNRYYLPILLSRIANGSNTVTLMDIERWDGNMTWLPSFSSSEVAAVTTLSPEPQQPSAPIADELENKLISEIYRNAARVFYFQRLRSHSKRTDEDALHPLRIVPNYDFQIQHFNSILLSNLRSLPLGSAYESSLLFPIGIAAIEIQDVGEKAYVLSRLQLLEERFQLNHFRKFREKLSAFWDGSQRFIGQQFACDAILLG